MAIRARDIMETEVHAVDAGLSLAALEDTLLRHRISGAPVLDHGALVGIVSRSDIVRSLSLERALTGVVSDFYRQILDESGAAAAAEWKATQALPDHLAQRQVRDIMTPELITLDPDAPVRDVARVMLERHIHRVLITAGRRLVGLVSCTDLVRLLAEGRLREA